MWLNLSWVSPVERIPCDSCLATELVEISVENASPRLVQEHDGLPVVTHALVTEGGTSALVTEGDMINKTTELVEISVEDASPRLVQEHRGMSVVTPALVTEGDTHAPVTEGDMINEVEEAVNISVPVDIVPEPLEASSGVPIATAATNEYCGNLAVYYTHSA
ncbi:hypothetical protein V6N13_134104 [Hibiscus sabdariffa]|uniref:Uncharacterized protein n=1 Tax=Hibiscus sabdariffa TaxID=183260 RepID=A0ABR2AW08_9ROSI